MANENRQKLFKAINKAGFDIGSYNDFDRRMNNAEDRQKFLQAVNDAGYDIGSQEEFERRISPSKYKLNIGGVETPVSEFEYLDFQKRHPSGSSKPSQPVSQSGTPQQQPQTSEDFQRTLQAPVATQPAPGTEDPVPEGTPWGTAGSGTGQGRAYKPLAPGQVRTNEAPTGVGYRAPFKKDLTAAEHAQIERDNDYAVRQMDQLRQEQRRREQPLVDTGSEGANKYVVRNQGEWEDDLQKGAKRISDSVVAPAVDKAIAEFDKKAHEVFESGQEKSNAKGGLPTGTAAGAGIFGNIREANVAKDPEKILNYLKQEMEGVYKDSSFIEEIGKEADRMGIDRNEYLEQVIKPQMQQDLATRFDNAMIAREMPKNSKEYVVNGLSNSIIGMIADAFLETKSQRAYKNQAEAMTENGQNPNYSPGTAASLAKMGVSFAADAPFFGLTGRVGGMVAKNLAERQIQNLMAKGLSEGAARSIVGTALQNSVGARMKNYIMQHVVSSGATLGGYNAISEGTRQVRDSEFDPLKLAASTAEGIATGAAFGLTGGVSQALSQPLSGIRRVGAKLAGFGAEAETLYGTEELSKMAQGEEGFENPFEGSVEALMKLGVMKVSSPGGLTKAVGEIIHPVKSNQKQRTGLEFSKEEESYIRDTADGKSLLDVLSNMHPEKAISEVNGKKKLSPEGEQMCKTLSDSYNNFMSNPELPATLKQKVAHVLGGVYRPGLETGADIIHNADGSVVLKTRDKDGNCIREMKFDNFSDADAWRENSMDEFRLNDAVNMWNATTNEQRSAAINEVAGMFGVSRQEAGKMVYAALDAKDTSLDRDQYNAIFGAVERNAYPADEYNPMQRYKEGQKMSAEERHIAQTDVQVAEEQLELLGHDFAEEIKAASQYADEKMEELATRKEISGDQIKAAANYYNAVAKLSGMMDEALKSVDEQVDAANAEIRRNTHPDSGALIEATFFDGNQQKDYYVSAGHIQITPDGKMVSSDGTNMVILRNKETGEIEVMNPSKLSVTAINDPNLMIEANESMEGLRGQLMKQADDSIELAPGTPETPQEMGEVFVGADGKNYMVVGETDQTGNISWLKIELDEQGNPTGNPQPLDIDEYRKAKSNEIDAANRPQTELSQSPGDQVSDQGENVSGVPEVEQPATEGQGDNMRRKDEGEGARVEAAPSSEAEAVGGKTPAPRIPVDEKGRQQFEQAKPEDTIAELTEKYGEDRAERMIDQMIKNTSTQIDELSKRDMSKVTDMNDIGAYEDEMDALKRKLDYWNGISQTIKAEKAKKSWENLVNPKEIRNFATDPESQTKWVDEHFDEIVDSYSKTHGNKLDPDEVRKAFTSIGYTGKNVDEFRKNEVRLVRAIYKKMLKDAVESGNTSITLLTGAGGAGKSTATGQIDLSDRGVVYDSALNSFMSLEKAILTAKNAGMTDIQVIAVYNDAQQSFSNTLERGLETERFLPIGYFTKAFLNNQGKIAQLKKAYPDVDIVCFDNSGNKSAERPNGGRVSVEEAEKWDYTVDEEKFKQLLKLIEDGINEGRFREDQLASIGRGLRDASRLVGEISPATEERVGRLVGRIPREDVGDLRPGASGEQRGSGRSPLVPAADGEVQGSSDQRPAEGEQGAYEQTPAAEAPADGETRPVGTGEPETSDGNGPEPPAAGGAGVSGSGRSGQYGPASGGTGESSTGGAGNGSGSGNTGGGSGPRSEGGSRSSEPGGSGQLAVDQKTGKLYQKRVEANIGRTFTFAKGDGGRTVLTIKRLDHNGYAVVDRQDYDAQGNAVGEPKEQRYHFTRVADAIGKGTWKKQLTVEEQLRDKYKFKVGDIPVLDVLTDAEQQQVLDAINRGDKNEIGYLTGELIEQHRDDFILRGRDMRNQKVDKAFARSGRGERLRGVRDQYRGFPEASTYLEDESMRPQTIEEYVAEALGDVPKMGEGFLAYDSYDQGGNTIVGLKDETGFGSRGFAGDTKGFNPWLAPKGKGISLKQFAEAIHEQLPEGLKEQYSDQDLRNIIHNVLTSAEKPTDIANYILRNRVEQAEAAAKHTEEEWMDQPSFQKVASENSFASRLQRGKQSVNTEPTEGQKEVGNYKKGHISFGGYDFTIENPEGSVRRGKDASGREWEQKMNNTYGYILGKFGKDGDHLDMFINDKADLDNWNGNVYVIDQVDPKTGKFDEHKVMYGFDSLEEAKQAYLSNYEKGWQGLGSINGVTKEGFDKWIDSSKRKIKEFADHSIAREHMVERDFGSFDSALQKLEEREISIDDPELLKEYGLKNVILSLMGDHLTLTHFIANEQGKGNGTRFMTDLARLADQKGWTLALTPDDSFGATSTKRLKDFYKRFGFKENRGRNADFGTRESMVRRPKDYQPDSPEKQEENLRNAVVNHLREIGIDVSDDWKEGQQILDNYNRRTSVDEYEEEPKAQKVSDQQTLEELNNGKTVKRYRAMQLIDGKLYPPMSAKVDGEMRQPTEIGVWEQAEERPDLIKNGKFVLNKGQKGQGNVPAAYNPYFHTSTSGLNDQFTSAYKRPELVVVEVEVPESELTSGYKAEGAKDAVGNVDWHSGVVNGQLPADRQRQVTLSRYSKVNRIVPDSEVADMIAKQLEGTNVEVPYNVVTPQLRKALEERGVKISDKPAGSVTEDINGNPIKQQKVYHGSGAEFDAFDHSHMGEGEGYQTFGYGTYVTEVPGIAEGYAEKGARKKYNRMNQGYGGKEIFYKGQKIDLQTVNPLKMAYDVINNEGTIKKAVQFAERLKDLAEDPEMKQKWQETIDILKDSKKSDFKARMADLSGQRYVYDVEIPDDNGENYLDYELKPTEKQLHNITGELFKLDSLDPIKQMKVSDMIRKADSIGNIIDILHQYIGGEATAKLLHDAGYTGTKYPTNYMAGGNRKGTKNYVIYDENDARITDTTKFFKTKDGHAYGYTYKGKIYLDPRIATAETPVHEYGHLWSEMKRQTSPDEWNHIKQVMLTDKLVQPIIDKVRRDYPELSKEGKEDDFIEEIITQFSGKRGTERLREIAQEVAKENSGAFGKAEAVTAMQRLKNILNRFWEGVAKMMGWKYRNANQIADRLMADMLNGLDPNAEIAKSKKERSEDVKPAKFIDINVKTPKMPEKQIEDLYEEGMTGADALNMKNRVNNMSPRELIEQYERLNSQMLDENGLNVDEQEDAFRRKWADEHGWPPTQGSGFGKASADFSAKMSEKYTYNKMALRWDIVDRIKELGLEAYIDPDLKDSVDINDLPEKETAEYIRMQRATSNPEPELTPEERQYWNKYEADLKKWRERNAIAEGVEGPGEKPQFRPGESAMDFAKRLVAHNREKALWQTAPKLEDYRQKREDKDMLDAARENEKRYPDSPLAKMRRAAAEFQQIRRAMSQQKAYDKSTVKAVVDFANDFMKEGFGDHLSRGEMERMLSSVKNATGAKDIRKYVDNIMNILTDNQLRNLDQQVQKLSSTKELSKTAQGVEKQGKLELKGQRMIQAFRDARQGRMDADKIRERMADVAEKMARDDDEAPMWEQEYEGLAIALQYAENIEASRDEYADLDREYKDAVKNYKDSGRSYKAQQELLESLDEAMMDNKIERIGMFGDIISRLQGNISESIEGAREFVEREKDRVKHIQQIANFDLAGKPADALREKTKGRPANFFLQPLGTFEQMLRQFGGRNANGEGYLYDYFMRNWMDSTDQAFLNEQKAKSELDEKAREVFGGKVKRWSDLYDIARSLPTMEVEMFDGENPKTFRLNQGNLLYIYMADKMVDGRMKLRKMGIEEEDVQAIKDFLDPRLVELGDWLQDDYLVKKRTEYNKVHERMFGAPMAAIDHYFPLKVLGDARYQEQDVANMADQDAVLPSTITGNIIKRRKNALPLDILHTDALSLAIEHVEDMERWAATAEWNKDINTLLSYTTFRNKVKNMDTIYGSGDALWNSFADTARMAAGTYRPKAKPGSVDAAISNIAKGVTAAKISFRVYTAFKQLLSAPAFLHDVRLDDFVKNSVNPYGSWKWAMENMPVFKKRWKSRQVGDTRLMDDPTDWKLWKTNIIQMANRMGMSPNALVDGVTCAVGARSIYESRYRKYKQIGASDELARKRALQDAEIGYNLTQQSSEGAFTSAIQKDRTVAANMLSVFRNSSMSYTRQWVDAARNLKKRSQKGYKEDAIKFMTGQFKDQFGLDDTQAKRAAELEYAREGRRDVARLLNMMFGVTVAWNLGASLPYLLIGDDNHTKKEMLTDALLKGLLAGPTEGFAAGNIWSDLMGRTLASEQTRKTVKEEGFGSGIDAGLKQAGDYEVNPLPLMADIQSMIKKMGYDKYAAAQDVFNIAMQSAVGVNPQTFTDMWNAIMDYSAPAWDGTKYSFDKENLSRSKELALFMMRVLNAPTSSWRNKYIDELGMNADDAKKLSYDEMAKRYAHYKYWKDAPIMGWLRNDVERQEKMKKIQKQFDKAVMERMNRYDYEELRDKYDESDSPDEKKVIIKSMKSQAKSLDNKDLLKERTLSNSQDERKMLDGLIKDRAKEGIAGLNNDAIRDSIGSTESIDRKNAFISEYAKRQGTQDYYGRSNSPEVYKRLRTYEDVKEDILVADLYKKNKEKLDKETLKKVNKLRNKVSKQRPALGDDEETNEEMMKDLRQWRREAIELLLRAESN